MPDPQDVDAGWSMGAPTPAQQAFANRNVANGVQPQAAVNAITQGGPLGIPPSVGMTQPQYVQQAADQAGWSMGVNQHPAIARFAAQSPAHAAAAAGSVTQLGAVSTQARKGFWDLAGDRWNQAHTAMLQAWSEIGTTLTHPQDQTFNVGPFLSLPVTSVPNGMGQALALGLGVQHVLGAGLSGAFSPIAAAGDRFQEDHPGLEREWGRLNIPGTNYYVRFGLHPGSVGDVASGLAQIAAGEALARGAPRGAPREQAAPGDTGPPPGPGPSSPESMGRQPFHNGTEWNTTSEGFLADEQGNPVGFASPRDAASWRMKNGGEQVFEPDLHAEGIGLRDVTARPQDPYWTTRQSREPVPGVDPQTDEMLKENAAQNAARSEEIEKAVSDTPLHQQSLELMRQYLDGTNLGNREVQVDPFVLKDLYNKGFQPFQSRIDDIEDAMFRGTNMVVPASEYYAEIAGKPWAQAVREGSVFTDAGISQKEATELGAGKDTHVFPENTSASMTSGEKFNIADLPDYVPDQAKLVDRILADNTEGRTFKQNPIPAGEIPREAKFGTNPVERKALQEKVHEAEANMKSQNIRLADLKSPQRSITQEAAENAVPKTEYEEEGVLAQVEKYHGKYYIRDGNHRVVKALSEGQTHGKVQVIDLDKYLLGKGEEAARAYEPPKDVPESLHEPLRTLAAQVDGRIDQIFQENQLGRIFENPKAIGMTAAQFERYGAALDEAKYAMRERVMKRMYNQIKRERTPDWKAAVELSTGEATKEIEGRPNVIAYRNLKDKLFKLDSRLVQQLAPELANEFPGNLQKQGGTDPDDMAEILGFTSGKDLISEMVMLQRAMDSVGAKTIDSFVKSSARLLATSMARELANFDGSPEGIEREVQAAVTGPDMEDFLIKELQAIKNAAGELDLKFDKDKIFSKAEDLFGKMPTKTAANVKFGERALQKTGRATEFALEKGNWVAAFKAKQQQLLNLYMLRMTHEFTKEVKKFERVGNRLARRKSEPSIPQEYMDQIHSFLQDYGWKVPQNNIKYNYDQWAEAMRNRPAEAGGPLQVQPYTRPQPTDYQKLSVNDFRDIADRLENLLFLAKDKGMIKILDQHLSMALLVRQALDAAKDVARLPVNPDATITKGRIDLDMVNGEAGGWMFSPHAMIDILDNRTGGGGVFDRVLMQGAKRAAVTEHDIVGPDEQAIADILQNMGPDAWSRMQRYVPKGHGLMRPDRPGLETNLTYKDLIGIMLHMGNKEGRWHLEEGGWGWDRNKYEDLVKREATPGDWELVDSIHKAVDALWPKIVEAERELTGLVPEKVKPEPIVLEHLRPGMGHNGGPAIDVEVHDGGYFPLRRDDRISSALKGGPQVDESSLWAHYLKEGATPKGHTIRRVAASYVPSLDWMNTIQQHIPNVAKRIAYGKWAVDALKFLSQPEIIQLVEEVHGPHAMGAFRGWLQRQLGYRTIDPRAPAGMDGVLRELRLRTYSTVAAMKISIGLEHATSVVQTTAQAGMETTLRGLMKWLSNPNQAFRFANESSNYMRIRADAVTRELRDIIDDIHNNRSTLLPYLPLIGRVHIPVLDPAMVKIREFSTKFFAWYNHYFAATPSYIGAYDAARAGRAKVPGRKGHLPAMDHDEAVNYAEKVVQKSHGSGFEMDMGTFQSGGGSEILKTLNMWNIFRGTFGSLLREAAYYTGRGQDTASKIEGWKALLIAAAGVPMVAALVTDRGPDKEESLGWWMLDQTLNGLSHMLPFGPNLYEAGKDLVTHKPLDFQVSPVEGVITTSMKGTQDVMDATTRKKVKDSRAIENAAILAGMLFHIPGAGQAGETLQAIHDISHPPPHKGRVTKPWQATVFGPSHERPQK
jgi:hypothetical protein